MRYRLATPADIEAINKLCENKGLERPTLGYCMVAEDGGKIIGYVNAMVVPMIDTVCENPIASKSLHDKFSGYLIGLGFNSEWMFTRKPEVESVAKKYGFIQLREGVNLYAKEI